MSANWIVRSGELGSELQCINTMVFCIFSFSALCKGLTSFNYLCSVLYDAGNWCNRASNHEVCVHGRFRNGTTFDRWRW